MYKRIMIAGVVFMAVSIAFAVTYKEILLRNTSIHAPLPFTKGMEAKVEVKDKPPLPVLSDVRATQKPSDLEFYDIEILDENLKNFINHVDGYSLTIPIFFEVDMRSNEVRTLLYDENIQLEIYKEELKNNVTPEAYISYSNQFKNTADFHHITREQWIKVQGYPTYVLQWDRKKSEKITNDKNYYASFDLIYDNKTVFTFLIKSTKSLSKEELGIIETFNIRPFTKVAKNLPFTGGKTSNREMALTTKIVYEKFFGDNSQLTWGIYEPNAPVSFQKLQAIENYINYKFPFIVDYQNFELSPNPNNIKNILNKTTKEGKILELSMQTTSYEQVYDILDGKYDPYIEAYTTAIKNAGAPVLMRLCNEMNGDWCSYCALHYSKDTTLFQEMYRYIYGKFEDTGANSYTLWVFNPNEKSFPDFKWNHSTLYYPGNEYVDIIGLTGYNTGTYYPDESWRSFDDIYQPIYKTATEMFEQPLMITEFASSSVGGNKVQWIKDMFQSIQKYDRIKVAIWWSGRDLDQNGNVARPYWINETQEILDTFKDYIKVNF